MAADVEQLSIFFLFMRCLFKAHTSILLTEIIRHYFKCSNESLPDVLIDFRFRIWNLRIRLHICTSGHIFSRVDVNHIACFGTRVDELDGRAYLANVSTQQPICTSTLQDSSNWCKLQRTRSMLGSFRVCFDESCF